MAGRPKRRARLAAQRAARENPTQGIYFLRGRTGTLEIGLPASEGGWAQRHKEWKPWGVGSSWLPGSAQEGAKEIIEAKLSLFYSALLLRSKYGDKALAAITYWLKSGLSGFRARKAQTLYNVASNFDLLDLFLSGVAQGVGNIPEGKEPAFPIPSVRPGTAFVEACTLWERGRIDYYFEKKDFFLVWGFLAGKGKSKKSITNYFQTIAADRKEAYLHARDKGTREKQAARRAERRREVEERTKARLKREEEARAARAGGGSGKERRPPYLKDLMEAASSTAGKWPPKEADRAINRLKDAADRAERDIRWENGLFKRPNERGTGSKHPFLHLVLNTVPCPHPECREFWGEGPRIPNLGTPSQGVRFDEKFSTEEPCVKPKGGRMYYRGGPHPVRWQPLYDAIMAAGGPVAYADKLLTPHARQNRRRSKK
jgi:hypothetical protein